VDHEIRAFAELQQGPAQLCEPVEDFLVACTCARRWQMRRKCPEQREKIFDMLGLRLDTLNVHERLVVYEVYRKPMRNRAEREIAVIVEEMGDWLLQQPREWLRQRSKKTRQLRRELALGNTDEAALCRAHDDPVEICLMRTLFGPQQFFDRFLKGFLPVFDG